MPHQSKPDAKATVLGMHLPLEESAKGVFTYWRKSGTHQKLYDDLYALLVPAMGECDTEHGEFLRECSNVYYDVYNNGGCNFDGGRRSDLVNWLDALEEHEYPRINELRKLFEPFLQEDWDADDADEMPDNFGRHHIPILEEAVDFTVLKVDELNKRIQQ